MKHTKEIVLAIGPQLLQAARNTHGPGTNREIITAAVEQELDTIIQLAQQAGLTQTPGTRRPHNLDITTIQKLEQAANPKQQKGRSAGPPALSRDTLVRACLARYAQKQ